MNENGLREGLRKLLRFSRYLLPYRGLWSLTVLLSLPALVPGLLNPYLGKMAIDDAFAKRDLGLFILLAVVGGSIFVIRGLIDGVQRFLETCVTNGVVRDLNRDLFEHVQGLSLGYFQDQSTGRHIYRMSSDVEAVADFAVKVPSQVTVIFPKALLLAAIVFYLDWEMGLFALVLIPLFYFPTRYLSARRKRGWQLLIECSEALFRTLHETFSHIHIVKAFGTERFAVSSYMEKLAARIRCRRDFSKLEITANFIEGLIHKAATGVIAFLGGYQVIKGQMTLGSYVAIMAYLGQLLGMYGQLASLFHRITMSMVSCERLNELLLRQPEVVEAKNARDAVFDRGRIAAHGITFGFAPGRPLFRNIDFEIAAGSHVAIVGPSGCGKTTLISLILRLYDPWQGEIIIDGHRVKDITLCSLKGQIGVVLQNPFLFCESIAYNIGYGCENATEDRIREAARICEIHEFIMGLPDRYQSVLGEDACKISQGQRQKIALARAIIKKPKILIFDEASASIDSASEEKILANVKHSHPDITIITVSHRLSTVRKAEVVYHLEAPDKVRPVGHSDLSRDPALSDLFGSQMDPDTRP